MTLSAVVASGSVTGADHRRAERDGQDGHAIVTTPDVAAAIVTDGCSSGRNAEVGARLAAAWLATLVAARFASVRSAEDARAAATRVTRALFKRVRALARSLDMAPKAIEDLLLFGFLAAVVTRDVVVVFGVGDGAAWIGRGREATHVIVDPGPDNAPPYLAYGLFRDEPLAPRIHFVGAAADVDAVCVMTDGVLPLGAEDLAAIARDPRYAKNASLLRKRLVVLAREGRFHDDATMGVVQLSCSRGSPSSSPALAPLAREGENGTSSPFEPPRERRGAS